MNTFIPSDFQPSLNPEEFIVPAPDKSNGESIELDVLFVGAGPASLASAIKLADLLKASGKELEIGIMEKADELGGHTLSGAVINPLVFQWLFPEKKGTDWPFKDKITKESFYFLTKNSSIPLPTPPGMKNKGYYTASLCEVVRWLGKEAEQRGIHIFTSFPANQLLVKENQIVGVASKAFGINKDGSKETTFEPASNIFAKAVILSEGSRGHLTQAWLKKEKINSQYPQTYALGVKEIWEVKKPLERVIHTIAWPLDHNTFGGSWFYPMGKQFISIGLMAGLDSTDGDLSIQDKLQTMKKHPLFSPWLKEGKCVEWGAKTVPEGGWNALPEKLYGNGILIIGDSAGFVNMASLKGIHYAMASGIFAAETLFHAFQKGDFSKTTLKMYAEKIQNSFIKKDLYKSRNLRQLFHKGLFKGLFKAGLNTLTLGQWPSDFHKKELLPDAHIKKSLKNLSPKETGKQDAVFLSGNKTRDQIPSHLKSKENIPSELGAFYQNLCPAGVYEQKKHLLINAPNCIDCKATDILGPRWSPRERGSGPHYKQM